MRSREIFIAAAVAIVVSVVTLGLAEILPDAVAVIGVASRVGKIAITDRRLARARVVSHARNRTRSPLLCEVLD